jgi:hypothetical protein
VPRGEQHHELVLARHRRGEDFEFGQARGHDPRSLALDWPSTRRGPTLHIRRSVPRLGHVVIFTARADKFARVDPPVRSDTGGRVSVHSFCAPVSQFSVVVLGRGTGVTPRSRSRSAVGM